MAYSLFLRNPFASLYEPVTTVKEEEVKEEEVKVEEVKVGPKRVRWDEISPEEQEKALQWFLELNTPLLTEFKTLRECLLANSAVSMLQSMPTSVPKNTSWTNQFCFDDKRKILIGTALPFILKHLGIKTSYTISLFNARDRWYMCLSPVYAPAE